MLRVAYLADHPEAIRQIAVAFAREWPDYYSGRDSAAIQDEFKPRLQRDQLPLAYVAFDKNTMVGTGTLGGDPVGGRTDLQPWVTALWVDRRCRRRGIGRAIIEAIEKAARDLGHDTLYAGTEGAIEAFTSWGWKSEDSVEHDGRTVTIMKRSLTGS